MVTYVVEKRKSWYFKEQRVNTNGDQEDVIRLKGTRVGIETILYDYIHKELSPETIANTYTSLTLEQVYATILYYLHNKEAVTKYLNDWIEWGERCEGFKRTLPAENHDASIPQHLFIFSNDGILIVVFISYLTRKEKERA